MKGRDIGRLSAAAVKVAFACFFLWGCADVPSAPLIVPSIKASVVVVATGSFAVTGNLNTARSIHTATLLNNGKVLITGGFDGILGRTGGSGTVFSSAELYDPGTGTFSITGNMSAAREAHSATSLPNGQVLITGDGADIYDPSIGAFSPTSGGMSAARGYHTATLLQNGKVLIAGGTGVGGALSSAELYDPATRTFSPTSNMTVGRESHTATLLDNGKVLIAGGYSTIFGVGVGGTLYASAELYDPSTGSFSSTGSLTSARVGHTATLLPDHRVLITGGCCDAYVGGTSVSGLASAELYDPSTGVFSALSSTMTDTRVDHTATLLVNGQVLLTGGFSSLAGARPYFPDRASADLYDPVTRTFAPTGAMLSARFTHTATLLLNGQVLVAGGASGSVLATAELFTPPKAPYSTTVGHVFLQPVNVPPQSQSVFKIGSTIPVKFQLFLSDGVTPVSTAVATIQVNKVSDGVPSTVNETVVSTVPNQGSSFRYDTISQQYIFNLGTNGWATGTYAITALLDDGSSITVNVGAR